MQAGNPHYYANGNCVVESDTQKLLFGCPTSEIPDGIKSIANYAFYCTTFKGTEIEIPDSVEEIGKRAFYGVSTTEMDESNKPKIIKLVMGTGLKHIGESAFYCKFDVWIKDVESWCAIDFADEHANPIIWEGRTRVGGRYVDEQDPLIIPETVTEIKAWAFVNAGIHSLEIPKTTIKIHPTAFAKTCNLGTYGIDNVKIASDNPVYKKTANGLGIIDTSNNSLLLCLSHTSNPIDFSKETFVKVADYAFAHRLTYNVILPNTCKEIGDYAFESCRLKTIKLGTGLTTIGKEAFNHNSDLTQIDIPGGVEEISYKAFEYCGLTNVTLNTGLKTIGENAFSGNNGLTTITIPASVTKIEEYAFLGTGLYSAHFEDGANWTATNWQESKQIDLSNNYTAANELKNNSSWTYTKNSNN